MSIKSKIACEFSAERLAGGKPLYLWTFTFPALLPIDVACKHWQDLARDLVRKHKVFGLRVYELHPGGHGLHIHLLTTLRYDVRLLRPTCEHHGFGRINVTVIPASASAYVAKYVAKQHLDKRDDDLRGKRMWQPVGKKLWPCPVSRVCDISLESATNRVYTEIRGSASLGFKKALQYWRVAQLVVLGVLTVSSSSQGFSVGVSPVCRACLRTQSSYDFRLMPGTYCFDALEHDLGVLS